MSSSSTKNPHLLLNHNKHLSMASKPITPRKPVNKLEIDNKKLGKMERSPSWILVKGLFTSTKPQQQSQKVEKQEEESNKKCKKMRCSGSLCSNTKVMQQPELVQKRRASSSIGSNNSNAYSSSSSSSRRSINGVADSSSSSSIVSSINVGSTSIKGMPFRRLSGCYECRMVVDPVLGFTRDPSLRTSICSCSECGEIFMKPEYLELHQAVTHAVSELGSEDTSKNIVEIIFQSSWLKKQNPVCKIDRILKIQNTQTTISKFEQYRESIKGRAIKQHPKKHQHPRCIADGNELLRFHSTTVSCSLGLNGSSNLCNTIPQCKVCSIIKSGFKIPEDNVKGILTTATSGKAHDKAEAENCNGNVTEKRAMLVCRVIAGKVKKGIEGSITMDEYDSVVGCVDVGLYSNLDELFVFNPKAILPCFVVIYGGF